MIYSKQLNHHFPTIQSCHETFVHIHTVYILHSRKGGKWLILEPHIVFKLRKIGQNISLLKKKKKKTFIPIKAGLCKCSQAALLFNSIRMNDAAACNHAVNRN